MFPEAIFGVLGEEDGGRAKRGTGPGRFGVPTAPAPLPVETLSGLVFVRTRVTGGADDWGVRGPLELVGDEREEAVKPGGEFDDCVASDSSDHSR